MKLKRFLLRYYPPGIILEYEQGEDELTKPIDLLGLTPDTDIDVLLNQIIRQEPLLSEKRKPQLEKLVNKLIDKLEENADQSFYLFKILRLHPNTSRVLCLSVCLSLSLSPARARSLSVSRSQDLSRSISSSRHPPHI
jgi:antitoxin component of RelBE/YafQ-DinJ toxin-antitoxin module